MKKEISATTVVIVLVIVILILALAGWKFLGKKHAPEQAPDSPEAQPMMQDPLAGGGQQDSSIPPVAPPPGGSR